jgi:hypothetical protein
MAKRVVMMLVLASIAVTVAVDEQGAVYRAVVRPRSRRSLLAIMAL